MAEEPYSKTLNVIVIQTILTSNQKMQRKLQSDIRLTKITELEKSEKNSLKERVLKWKLYKKRNPIV